jgi:hypothetical protein
MGIAMTSNESIGKRESTLPHHHRRAHLDHQGSSVLDERHEIGHGEVARPNRSDSALDGLYRAVTAVWARRVPNRVYCSLAVG